MTILYMDNSCKKAALSLDLSSDDNKPKLKGEFFEQVNNIKKPDYIEIVEIQYQELYKLCLAFNDGKKQVVDFQPFLKKSHHPEIRKYLDSKLFQQYTFEHGHLHWNDYDLYKGVLDLL